MLHNYKGTNRTKCLCECECGNKCIRIAYNLKKSELPSCGCARKEVIKKYHGKDIDGLKFGRLTVIETLWDCNPPKVKCKCDCGKVVLLRKSDVQSFHTQSCGCLQKEQASKSNDVDHTNKVSDYGITILEKYKKNHLGQWIWKCKCHCGNIFYDIPARILNGHVRSCGCLKKSSNETFIAEILDKNGIDYKTQFTFDDCKSDKNYPLYFDFAIFKNNKLFCLFEYDGIQHFKPRDIFGGNEALLETQKRDTMKNNYCFSNNIELYRFDYTMTCSEINEKIMNIIYP